MNPHHFENKHSSDSFSEKFMAYKSTDESEVDFTTSPNFVAEDESVKLFIGQIPKDMDEESLIPYFSGYGTILELTIIRDKSSKNHRGCAFLTYARKSSASLAIQNLHDKVKLPNAANPIQVKPAEGQSERENKIFVGMLPKTVTEIDLHDMFAKYGQLKEIHIIRGPEGMSKGCAFVKFLERDAALLAIHELHNSVPEGSTRPLVIKFADNKKTPKGHHDYGYDKDMGDIVHDPAAVEEYWAQTQQRSNKSAPAQFGGYQNLHVMTNTSPQLVHTVPYVPYSPGSPVHQPYIYYPNGYYSPGHYGRVVNEAIPPISLSPQNPPGKYGAVEPDAIKQSQIPAFPQQVVDDSRPVEGPPGANIFIYHLPRDLTDADLATLFAPFGNVISAKVYVDKKTSESKGFGFVSYDAVASAEAAISEMNGFQIGTKRLKVQHKRINMYPQELVNPYVAQQPLSYPMVTTMNQDMSTYQYSAMDDSINREMYHNYSTSASMHPAAAMHPNMVVMQNMSEQQRNNLYVNYHHRTATNTMPSGEKSSASMLNQTSPAESKFDISQSFHSSLHIKEM